MGFAHTYRGAALPEPLEYSVLLHRNPGVELLQCLLIKQEAKLQQARLIGASDDVNKRRGALALAGVGVVFNPTTDGRMSPAAYRGGGHRRLLYYHRSRHKVFARVSKKAAGYARSFLK